MKQLSCEQDCEIIKKWVLEENITELSDESSLAASSLLGSSMDVHVQVTSGFRVGQYYSGVELGQSAEVVADLVPLPQVTSDYIPSMAYGLAVPTDRSWSKRSNNNFTAR